MKEKKPNVSVGGGEGNLTKDTLWKYRTKQVKILTRVLYEIKDVMF